LDWRPGLATPTIVQAAADVDPVFGLKVPAGQFVGAVAPALATQVLGGASVQVVAAGEALYVPAAHKVAEASPAVGS